VTTSGDRILHPSRREPARPFGGWAPQRGQRLGQPLSVECETVLSKGIGISDSLLDKPREQQVKEHYIAPGIVEAELREAGFSSLTAGSRFYEVSPRRQSALGPIPET
jgi:hypothetical protein